MPEKSRLMPISYYNPKQEIRLSAYADTIVLESDGRDGGDALRRGSAQILLQLRFPRKQSRDARTLCRVIAEAGKIPGRQLPERIVSPAAERPRPPPELLKLRQAQRLFLSRQRAAQKQHAPFRCRQRKRRRGGAFLGFGGSSSTSAPSSANFTGWTT